MSIVSDAPLTLTAIHAPQSKVSAPDYLEWHMILDNELDMLTDKETSLYGAIGFTALAGC
ncbi:MAG: hypothetical protein E5299_02251 [Burkholderia gladioli]|nr:MAG: hypothetical protein E5299_02251 [Burkholderia gladioli]